MLKKEREQTDGRTDANSLLTDVTSLQTNLLRARNHEPFVISGFILIIPYHLHAGRIYLILHVCICDHIDISLSKYTITLNNAEILLGQSLRR